MHHYADQVGAEERIVADGREQANVRIWVVMKRHTRKGMLVAFRRWKECTEQLEWRLGLSLQSRQSIDSVFAGITPQSASHLKERS